MFLNQIHGININVTSSFCRLVSKDFRSLNIAVPFWALFGQFEPTFDDDRYGSCLFYFLGNRAEDVVNYPLSYSQVTAFRLMNDATTMGMRSIIDASSLERFRINRVVFLFPKVLCGCKSAIFFSLIAVGIVMLVFHIPLTIYSFTHTCCFATSPALVSVFSITSALRSSLETLSTCGALAATRLDVWYTIFYSVNHVALDASD